MTGLVVPMPLLLLGMGSALVLVAAVALVIALLLILQPGNPELRDHAALLSKQPYIVFWIVSNLHRMASVFQQLKPAPLRVAEVAVSFIHSQVLFVMVNLNIAEALKQGPKTAQQLAEAAGPQVNAEWLARVLKLAAELGLVKRTRVPGINPQLLNACEDTGGATGADDTNNDAQLAKDQTGRSTPANNSKPGQGFTTGYSCYHIYSANAITAVLCRAHPNCMADFVKMFEDHYSLFESLSEGISTSTIPFVLWPKAHGPDFWAHLKASPRHAATFDGAMRACNHTGASMAVEQYPWNTYDVVVDIAGGNGQLLAQLLSKHSSLQGVLVDQQEQVERGKKWWSQEFSHLLPRMTFVVGDMFNPASLPAPRLGQKTLYVLKQVLHDWSDTDSLAILKAIRAVISDEDVAAGSASLAVLETGTFETRTPAILQHRLEADITMLASFGDGKERDEAQSHVLLRATGFKPGRLVATTGLMTIQEATPAPTPPGAAVNGTEGRKDKLA